MTLLACPLLADALTASVPVSVLPSQLFDQLSSSDGSLLLQVFGPATVILAVLGACAATLDLKLLLLVVRHTHTHTHSGGRANLFVSGSFQLWSWWSLWL